MCICICVLHKGINTVILPINSMNQAVERAEAAAVSAVRPQPACPHYSYYHY